MVRKAKKSDISSIAHIHFLELHSDFLPSLGENFLRLLYTHLFQNKNSHLYVIYQNSKINGFILGSVDFNATFKNVIMKNFTTYAFLILPSVIRRPKILRNVFETLLYTKKEGKNLPTAEIIAIAILKEHHREGFGKQLTSVLEEKFLQKNIKEYKVTVNADNYAANSFYKVLGFTKKSNFYLYGRKINLYTKKIR